MEDIAAQETDSSVPFASWLFKHRKGRLNDEISDGMRAVVAAVADTGKPGKVQVVLTIKPQPGTDALVVTDETRFVTPQHDRAAALYFATDDGDLTREDPHQPTLPFDGSR